MQSALHYSESFQITPEIPVSSQSVNQSQSRSWWCAICQNKKKTNCRHGRRLWL